MKNIFLIFPCLTVWALLLFIPVQVQSQSSFGIRAGLNVTSVSFENLPGKSELFGYHLGVFADLPVIADFMSLQPELSYTTKGVDYEILGEDEKLNMNYVEFLLPVGFHLGSIDVQVGPTVSYLVSTADYKVFNETTVIVDAFNKVDAGLTAGLSYNFNHFLFGIRFTQGLVNVTNDNAMLLLGEGKNAAGQVSLGYRF